MSKYMKLIVLVVIILLVVLTYTPIKNTLNKIVFFNEDYLLLNSDEQINLHQVITKDITNSRTIMWQSLNDRDNFVFEIGLDKQNLKKLLPQKTILDFNNEKVYIYKVNLTDLQENNQYFYRIGYENYRSSWQSLQTTNNNKFKALIFPDSQSSDYKSWQQLVTLAWQNNSDANFFINMGDLVDNGYDLTQWNEWFYGVQDMINKIPVAPLLGNHETYTMDWQVAMPILYLNFFDLPSNSNDIYKNQYYSFDYGNIHFIVLNTQDNELKDFVPELLNAQINWLEKDLASTDKKWKIVLMHKDILNYGRDAMPLDDTISFTPYGEKFMPIFDKYKVDAVLTAHLHTYRRRVLLKDFKPNDNGTLYLLTGVAGDVRYPNLWHKNPLDKYIAPQPETDNYITLEADENNLIFTAYLPDNTLLDSVTLTKN